MTLYFWGARSLAKAEGLSIEEARKHWDTARHAVYTGNLARVLVLSLALLVAGHLLRAGCESVVCSAFGLLVWGTAFLLCPSYMAIGMSRRAKQAVEEARNNGGNRPPAQTTGLAP